MIRGRKGKIIIAAVAVVLIVVWITVSKMRAAKENEPIIETAKVERSTVTSTVSASGTLQPLTTVDVKSNAGGQVTLLAVDVGDIVHTGQLIAKIDPTNTQTALEQAQADLSAANARVGQAEENMVLQREQSVASVSQAQQAYESAKARLAQARMQAQTQPTLTKTSIQQAQANYESAQESLRQLREAGVPEGTAQAKASYDSAKANLDKAKRNYDRQLNLHNQGFISTGTLDNAKADYENAKAQLESAQTRMNTVKQDYDSQLRNAQARVEQTEAALANAKANRVQDKVKQQDYQAALAAVKQSQAALAAARSNLRQVSIRAADIRSAQATVVRNRASVTNAQKQLSYATIVAPRPGVILQKYVEVGNIITSGSSSFAGTGAGTSIVQLGDTSRMFVEASVDETDIAQVEMGQAVDITLDAYPDEIFEGKVTKISPQTVVTQNVTTVPVTVEIDSPDARLKPGMNATCNFIVERKEDVLMVPTEAVKDQDGRYTVTVMKNGKMSEQQVEVGLAGDEGTEIVSGLQEGDTVVTSIIDKKIQPLQFPGGRGPGMPMGGMGGMGGGRRGMR